MVGIWNLKNFICYVDKLPPKFNDFFTYTNALVEKCALT